MSQGTNFLGNYCPRDQGTNVLRTNVQGNQCPRFACRLYYRLMKMKMLKGRVRIFFWKVWSFTISCWDQNFAFSFSTFSNLSLQRKKVSTSGICSTQSNVIDVWPGYNLFQPENLFLFLARQSKDMFTSLTIVLWFGVVLSIIGSINSTHGEPRNCQLPAPDHQLQ